MSNVCTFSVMSRSQESMLSVNRSSMLLPWLEPNTLWLAWKSWLQGEEHRLETSNTGIITNSTPWWSYSYRVSQLLNLPFHWRTVYITLLNAERISVICHLAPLFLCKCRLTVIFLFNWSLVRSGHSPSKRSAGNLSIGAETREKLWVAHSFSCCFEKDNYCSHHIHATTTTMLLLPLLVHFYLVTT